MIFQSQAEVLTAVAAETITMREAFEELIRLMAEGRGTEPPAPPTQRQARDDELQHPTQGRFAEFDAYNAGTTPDYKEFPR